MKRGRVSISIQAINRIANPDSATSAVGMDELQRNLAALVLQAKRGKVVHIRRYQELVAALIGIDTLDRIVDLLEAAEQLIAQRELKENDDG